MNLKRKSENNPEVYTTNLVDVSWNYQYNDILLLNSYIVTQSNASLQSKHSSQFTNSKPSSSTNYVSSNQLKPYVYAT